MGNNNTRIEKWLEELDVDLFGVADMSLYGEEVTGIERCAAGLRRPPSLRGPG